MKSEPTKHFASLAHTVISMGSNYKSLPLAHLEQATFSPPPVVPNRPYGSNPHPSPLRKINFQSVHTVYRPPVRLTCSAEETLTRPNVIRTDPSPSPSRVFASTKSAQCSLVSSSSCLASKWCIPQCFAREKYDCLRCSDYIRKIQIDRCLNLVLYLWIITLFFSVRVC